MKRLSIFRLMNQEQFEQFLKLQERQAIALEQIAQSLSQMKPVTVPNYQAVYVGKDKEGKNQYERLITFRPFEEIKAEPISRKVAQILKND